MKSRFKDWSALDPIMIAHLNGGGFLATFAMAHDMSEKTARSRVRVLRKMGLLPPHSTRKPTEPRVIDYGKPMPDLTVINEAAWVAGLPEYHPVKLVMAGFRP